MVFFVRIFDGQRTKLGEAAAPGPRSYVSVAPDKWVTLNNASD